MVESFHKTIESKLLNQFSPIMNHLHEADFKESNFYIFFLIGKKIKPKKIRVKEES
jgi:hypothetical protein